MRPIAAVLAIVAVLVLALPAAHAGTQAPVPTHVAFAGSSTAKVGDYTSLAAVLHNSTSNEGIAGQTLAFSLRTTFGWLPLGNATTDGDGKAAVDYRPVEPGTLTILIAYGGNATYTPSNATASVTVGGSSGGASGGLPIEAVIVLIVFALVGGIWLTYAYVVGQVLGIRADAPARPMWRRRGTRTSEVTRMAEENEAQHAPSSARTPSRAPMAIGAAGLALALVAVALAGIGMATPKAPAYTPETVDLQVVVVPDMKGAGWDSFVPSELIVHKGDSVRFTVFNADTVPHGFRIETFGVDKAIPAATADNATGDVTPSQTPVPTFIADQVGSFLIRCNVPCGDGHEEMTGTLVVLPD